MAGDAAPATPLETQQFSIKEYQALKAAAKIVRARVTSLSELLPKISEVDTYSLPDCEILDAAANILEVTFGSVPVTDDKSTDAPPYVLNPAAQEVPLQPNNLRATSSGNSGSLGNRAEAEAAQASLTLASGLDLAADADFNTLLHRHVLNEHTDDLAVVMDPGSSSQTLRTRPSQTTLEQIDSQGPSVVQNVPLLNGVHSSESDEVEEITREPSFYDIGSMLEPSTSMFSSDNWQWDPYPNMGFVNSNVTETLIPTGADVMYSNSMGIINGFNSAGVHDPFGNVGSGSMTTPQNSIGLDPSSFYRIGEQTGSPNLRQGLEPQFAWDLNNEFDQPYSLPTPDRMGHETVPPPKKQIASKSANPPQRSSVIKIQKARGNASEKATVARLQKLKGPYLDDHVREQIGQTRTTHACIRCQMQKSKCRPNPDDPNGICMRCIDQVKKLVKGPCLRLILMHCLLYRKTTTQKIRQIPSQYSNCNPKCPNNSPLQLLELENVRYGQVFKISIQQYELSQEERTLPLDTAEGNLLTKRPYQIPNTQEFVNAFNTYIITNAAKCVEKMLDKDNKLTWEIFAMAFRLVKADAGPKSKVVSSALRFWITARSNESGWVIRNPHVIGIGSDSTADIHEAPYVEHQIGWILMNNFLAPFCTTVLRDMQAIYASTQADDWLSKFLATFIILHSYEMLVKRQKAFTIKRKWNKTPFTNMNLLNNIHLGAKTILAFYHYSSRNGRSCKNGERFSMNWDTNEPPTIAGFTGEDKTFLEFIAREANAKKDKIQLTSKSDRWEDEFWFTGQMFDSRWEPRIT